MAEIGSVIDGKYEVLREIGRGGMSVVYLAMDMHLNKQWAVKEIRKKGSGKNDEIVVNSLLAEANMMKKLDHPALPRIVDIIDNGLTIYVIMDYIEGESLDKILNEYGAQPEELVIGWAKQLCDALSYLHTQKPPIIYRDMKPANVMLKPEGNIKIIDFGIAREYKEQKLSDTTVLGTKGYAPPEQYSGQTDARSDIFALGMTMHHLLTGIDPRSGEAYAPVRMWNPELSEGIEIIIDKCVEPAAENRYQNCADLLYDLEHPELITRDYKKKQKRKVRLFVASAALTIMALISGIACNRVSANINNNNYDSLISVSTSTSLEEKVESYKEAIEIYPYRTDAYIKLLEAYEDEGQFGKNENDEFLALYNQGKDGFDVTSESEAELNYKIGTMYFNYYTEEDGSYSVSNRVQKAYSFFSLNYENADISPDFSRKSLSDCYYRICYFYKKYILSSSTVEEAAKSNYEDLFNTINESLENVKNASDASAYDQLSLYNAVFMLLYDQRSNMMQVNVEQEDILEIMDDVYNEAKELSVQKEQSQNLQQEIITNYESYRNAIVRTYSNAEGRQ
jgi:serine/threonine-protein kinase